MSSAPPTDIGSPSRDPIQLKFVDMADDKLAFLRELVAAQSASTALSLAGELKRAFDARFGPLWHCVVGCSFGSMVTHQPREFIYFFVGPLAVLLWKCGDGVAR